MHRPDDRARRPDHQHLPGGRHRRRLTRRPRRMDGRRPLVTTLEGEKVVVFSFPLEPPPLPGTLTPAERAIVLALLSGKSNAQIARAGETSPRTVANQLASLLRTLGVRSRSIFLHIADELKLSTSRRIGGESPPLRLRRHFRPGPVSRTLAESAWRPEIVDAFPSRRNRGPIWERCQGADAADVHQRSDRLRRPQAMVRSQHYVGVEATNRNVAPKATNEDARALARLSRERSVRGTDCALGEAPHHGAPSMTKSARRRYSP